MAELPSGTVTFLLTDVEGSTPLWQEAEAAMRRAAARHDDIFEDVVREYGGVHIRPRGEGDSRFGVFSSAPNAVAAAVAIQRAFAAEAWPTPSPIKVRIGIHTGEAQLRDGDYYGTAVNRCARLRNLGHGGQILISGATAALTRERLPSGASLRDLGQHRLRGLTEPEHVFQVVVPGLPHDFPPLASQDARLNNLPIQPTALLGREREVADVCALLQDGTRLVTLTGPGGTGKTRLSLQIAAELLDSSAASGQAFEHGVCFVELAPISDPALVTSTVAQTLGLRDSGGRPILDSLEEYLRGRSLLLVLDNFEQIVAAAPAVAELLSTCPNLKVLVSSREALHLRAEREYAVPPLQLPDAGRLPSTESLSKYAAVALFVERAAAVKADFSVTNENALAVAEICRRLDGLPLAIELAAARVRLLPPQTILARLERRLPLLTGGARDLPARQQTLRGAIAWSHDLLDDAERGLFRRLAVFIGGWTLEAAEHVVRHDDLDVLDGLESLISKSLVTRDEGAGGEPRFRMLETIREFAAERLDESGEEVSIRRRHAQWCLRIARRPVFEHGEDHVAWLDLMSSELDNLRAALTWSIADQAGRHDRTGLRLAVALWTFWFQRAHQTEGRRWLVQALAADRLPGRDRCAAPGSADGQASEPDRSEDDEPLELGASPSEFSDRSLRVGALNGLAILAAHQRDLVQSDRHAEEALELARRVDDALGRLHALNGLGNNARFGGHFARSASYLEESVALGRQMPENHTRWRGLSGLGETVSLLGDYERAQELLEECLQVAHATEHYWNVGQSLHLLGRLALWRGDLDRAERLLDESVGWWRRANATIGPHWALELLGRVARARGEVQRATSHFLESLGLSRDAGDRRGTARCLEGLASAATTPGPSDSVTALVQATRLLGAAEAIREEIGFPMYPGERPPHEQAVAAARARLGEAQYASAWAEGRALPLDRAIEAALRLADEIQAADSEPAPDDSV